MKRRHDTCDFYLCKSQKEYISYYKCIKRVCRVGTNSVVIMSAIRVSSEELKGDLEKLQNALQTLCSLNINYSSMISSIRVKYDRVLNGWIKSKRTETIHVEDTISRNVIVDQNS